MDTIYNFNKPCSLPTHSDIRAMSKEQLENFCNQHREFQKNGGYSGYALVLSSYAFEKLQPKPRKKRVKKQTFKTIECSDELPF